jgi:hypothetical protein
MTRESPAPDPTLLAAYRAAEYVVPIGSRICRFRIGEPVSEPLGRRLDEHGAAGWVSAFNPCSRPLPLLENLQRHQRLWQHLRAEGLAALVGYSADPEGRWPDETSLLVPEITVERLNQLALNYGQLAFLWLEPGQPPRMWLAHPDGPRPDQPPSS